MARGTAGIRTAKATIAADTCRRPKLILGPAAGGVKANALLGGARMHEVAPMVWHVNALILPCHGEAEEVQDGER